MHLEKNRDVHQGIRSNCWNAIQLEYLKHKQDLEKELFSVNKNYKRKDSSNFFLALFYVSHKNLRLSTGGFLPWFKTTVVPKIPVPVVLVRLG